MDRAPAESDARLALRDLSAFVDSEHNSVPCFYSCEISTPPRTLISWGQPYFNVSLVRRRSLAIESECHSLDESPIFRIGAGYLLKAIRILVACPTLTHAKFSFFHSWGAYWWPKRYVPPGFEDLMSKFYSLLNSSPSISCFDIRNSVTDVSLYCKDLPMLVCENPRLETLIVSAGGPNFVVLAEALAVCLPRNTILKSFTLRISIHDYELNRDCLGILLRPFTSSLPGEANVDLKELALYLQYSDGHSTDAIANLVCRNTTLEKLDLGFLKFRSCLKDGKSSWREIGRALEVNQTLKELSCFCDLAALRELLVPFVPDRYCRQPNTTLSTLRLFVSNVVNEQWVQTLVNSDNLGGVLRDLASALELNTTLKHVQFVYEWDGYLESHKDEVKYITDKNLWRVEFQIREILKMMIRNELRVNTSLESFAVGNWTLLRVGTEWQTSYRGPCLREQTKEYTVKVKMTP
ncbi:hypothetical protein M758_7G085100 [Ceratodon purpureus]|nr:hypothetical protein M758_7G085100 [Ceratodon purpureus]